MNQQDKDMAAFLSKLAACEPNGARRKDLRNATREEDAIRQRCRREGLAKYADAGAGLRWHITDKGRAFLEDS